MLDSLSCQVWLEICNFILSCFVKNIFYLDLYSIYNNDDLQEMQLDVDFDGAGPDTKSKPVAIGFLYYLFFKFLDKSETSNYLSQI